ncbi:hypothetical protein LTR46_008287 [Exophiala xenobiotica]|nr:hypothetical protein LTR46_008287 [Exophiala xenobiotica]
MIPMPSPKTLQLGVLQSLSRYYWFFAVTGAHNDKTEILPPHLQPVHRYAAVRDSALRGAMQSKLLFAGLMVIMAARMVHISRIPTMNFPPPEYYLELTLQEIRERMLECQVQGTPVDSGLLRSIQCLALAEWICRRYDAATIHVQAAKKLFPQANFGHPSDAFAREGIVNIDNLICIETGRLPEFPVMHDPGPLKMSRMALIRDEVGALAVGQVNHATHPHSPVQDATRPTSAFVPHQVDVLADASTTLACTLGSGFEPGLAADAVHPLLAPVLRDILDVLTVAKYVWRTPNATERDADWMCKRARALVHRLLLLRANPFFSEQTISARKVEVLRIALLLVLTRCTNRVAFRSAQPNMRRLQHALHGIDKDWSTNKTTSWGTEAEMTGSSCQLQPESPASTPSWDSSSSSSSPSPLNAPFGRPLRDPQSKQYDQNALLLWALMTGHFNAQGEPEESWFLERAVYVAETHLGIHDYDGLVDFMSQYFYSKTRQQHSLMIVALHLS